MKNFHGAYSILEIITIFFALLVLALMIYGHTRENTGGDQPNVIINNLRILKTAALVLHEKSPDVTPSIEEIISCAGGGIYPGFNFVESNGESFITFEKTGVPLHEKVKKKLTARAESVGLLGSENNMTAPTEKYNSHEAVCLRVR